MSPQTPTTNQTQTDVPDQFTGWASKGKGEALEQWSYTPKAFEAGDVDIRISHCGICGSDVHTLDSGWGPTTYPVIVGHEIVGEVVRVGSAVTHLQVGQRVGVGAQSGSCRDCVQCREGEENYCSVERTSTYNSRYGDGTRSQGGYANYTRVPAHFAIPVPEGLPSAAAASLFCAGVTTYLPLRVAEVGPGKTVGVVGIGGLGHLGIQWARAMGADKVYAVSHSASKKEDARKLGATDFIVASNPEEIAAHDRTLDVLLVSACGSKTRWEDYFKLMKTGGKMMLVGLPDEPLGGIPSMMLCVRKISLIGSLVGSPSHIEGMLKLAAEKGVRVWEETRPMSEVNEVLEDFRKGSARYRYVLEN